MLNYKINNVPIEYLYRVSELYKYALSIDFTLDDCEFGYNENSSYVYLSNEGEIYSLGIQDFHGGEIEFIYADNYDGYELILTIDDLEELVLQNVVDADFFDNQSITDYFIEWQDERDDNRDAITNSIKS
jgi:hypothetical protein